MGNICCGSQQKSKGSKQLVKSKRTFGQSQAKRNYELQTLGIINDALFKHSQKYQVDKLQFVSLLGKGGQAEVYKIYIHSTSKNKLQGTYAMKRIPKKKLDTQRTKQAIMLQKQIMISHPYPFITQIEFAFQDKLYLYLLMKLAKGGDAYSIIMDKKKSQLLQQLGQYAIKFIIAGCILGIKYLHKNHIIYRDLKPQNVFIFQNGYPKIADFGVAQKNQSQLCFGIKGTTFYLAPQMFNNKGYNHSIDLWALGVLTYQLLFKQPPFKAELIQSNIFEKIIKKRHQKPLWPLKEVSVEAKDFIKRLLVADPHERLGFRNFNEIMTHPFFQNFDWQGYERNTLVSPLKDLVNKYPVHSHSQINIDELVVDTERDSFSRMLAFTFVQKQSISETSVKDNQQTCCPQSM